MRAAPFPLKTSCGGPAKAVTPANAALFERINSKKGYGNEHPEGSLLSTSQSPNELTEFLSGSLCAVQLITTSLEGSCTGSERYITASIIVKIAVLAPIPSARVSTATAAKPGLLVNIRRPYRRSWKSAFMAQCHHRVHPGRASCGKIIGEQCDKSQ